MKERPLIDLGMTGYDELFMNDAERREAALPKIYNIPLSEIDDFPDHPFQVRLDEDMDQLVESVKERGVITPITLRRKTDGRYEIVSGHRRRKACELAGFATVPAEIKELTRDEAIILMVESNLQRSTILPSEKAFSYKMRLEAMKRQGQRTDLTFCPMGTKLNSAGEIARQSSDSERQVFRYIRLTELIPDLLTMVDEGRIALRPAVELSYLGSNRILLRQSGYRLPHRPMRRPLSCVHFPKRASFPRRSSNPSCARKNRIRKRRSTSNTRRQGSTFPPALPMNRPVRIF